VPQARLAKQTGGAAEEKQREIWCFKKLFKTKCDEALANLKKPLYNLPPSGVVTYARKKV
jgi:hypothetical protein